LRKKINEKILQDIHIAWYVIAKTVIKFTPEPKDSPPKHGSVKYLSWKKK